VHVVELRIKWFELEFLEKLALEHEYGVLLLHVVAVQKIAQEGPVFADRSLSWPD
jgi:hypothetical protein